MSVQLALYMHSEFFLLNCNYVLKVIVKGLSLIRSGNIRVRKNIKTFLDLFFPNIKNTERETLQNDSFVTSQLKKIILKSPKLDSLQSNKSSRNRTQPGASTTY